MLYGQLTQLGVECAVVAPTLVPTKAGDLTAVRVPDGGSEALRDLMRAHEAAKQDQLRARNRLGKFLLRMGRRPAVGMKAWTEPYMAWVRQVWFEQPAQHATLLDYLHEVDPMQHGSSVWSRRSRKR